MYSTPTTHTTNGDRASRADRPWTPSARLDTLPRVLFVDELLANGLAQVAQDEFAGTAIPDDLARLGDPVLVRATPSADEVEAFLRLRGGELVLVDVGHGEVTLDVAARTRTAAEDAAKAIRAALASEAETDTGRISVAFWMNGPHGAEVRHREIDAPAFDAIAHNYESSVRATLERLAATRAPESGKLILWRGIPGTGKSHALRALARSWSDWCSTHFVMDPEELFGRGGSYMLDLLTWGGEDEERWRLVALEDAGELIAADARAVAGQSLSRLLNLTDGILGQGMRTLVLITTNEPVGRLHPATRRPGRCLADIEFKPLSTAQANAWLAQRGDDRRVTRPTALAQLFGGDTDGHEDAGSERFGFARAIDRR